MSRILLVEDDDVARRLLADELSGAGFSPVCVDSGEAALAALDAEPGAFAAIVCDVALPGLSGPQALARASAASLGGAAVIFLSGYGEPDASGLARSRPVRSLQKPAAPGAVARALTELAGG